MSWKSWFFSNYLLSRFVACCVSFFSDISWISAVTDSILFLFVFLQQTPPAYNSFLIHICNSSVLTCTQRVNIWTFHVVYCHCIQYLKLLSSLTSLSLLSFRRTHFFNMTNSKSTVVVKRQAEEVGTRAPDKLRAQKNLKLKTRARLNKRARKQKSQKALKSKYG